LKKARNKKMIILEKTVGRLRLISFKKRPP